MYWSARRGVKDFILQRATAVVLTLYTGLVLSFFLFSSAIDYTNFIAFFGNPAMKVASFLSSVGILKTMSRLRSIMQPKCASRTCAYPRGKRDARRSMNRSAVGADHCGAPTEAFINCCNVDCNRLHLVCGKCLTKHKGFCQPECSTAPRRRLLSLALAPEGGQGSEGAATLPLDLAAVLATTQGPAPNARDVNRLSAVKPHNVRRNEFDADKHLSSPPPDHEGQRH